MSYEPQSKIEGLAIAATRWVGSVQSLVIHTILFITCFAVVWVGFVGVDKMLLVVTTIVSLEAIYLAIFIQMTVNRQTEVITEVEHDIDEMQEDVGEIQEDIDEIQKDVDEIQEDVDEIQEGVEELSEEEEKIEPIPPVQPDLANIHARLAILLKDVERLGKIE
jgi:septal ring factor EnvC (AmiA/AmiB activator)